MSDNISVFNEHSDNKLCCKGTDLDDEDHFCTKNLHADKQIFGESKDYDLLSDNASKFSDWKETNAHISVVLNQSTKEMHEKITQRIESCY